MELNYAPFKFNPNGQLSVPRKYEDAFIDDDIPLIFSINDYEFYRNLLASYCWMDCWFANQPWTINTKKIGTCAPYFSIDESDEKPPTNFFTRINSVSPKENKCDDIYHAFEIIDKSQRCQDTIKLAKELGRDIIVYARDWIDFSAGHEFRVFIFETKIVAISQIDMRICEIPESEIIQRAQKLLDKCKYDLPLPDVCMDILLTLDDIVVEFNSYGFWGNSSAELFDWREDAARFAGLMDDIEVRKNN